jgi:general nucleoside transport system permease protein
MNMGADTFWVAVAAGMIRSATPVLYATLGEIITERSGILNVGLEGIMLVGALTSVAVSYHTGSAYLGILAAIASAAVLGLLHAILSIQFQTNQIATGIAMTIFGSGLSAYLGIDYVGKQIQNMGPVKLPWLGDLPVVGPIFFCHDLLVYGTYVLVPALAFILYRTRVGLSLRSVGEAPHSAAAAGIKVERVRYIATICGAALAGLGGAYLSLVYAQGWTENITAGRGWIAVGLVLFAFWNPWRAVLGAYLFGGAISLQLRLQAAGSDISPYLLGMAPYILVIAVLCLSKIRQGHGQLGAPTALSEPYTSQV